MLRAYQRLLRTRPLTTQIISAGTIAAAGDVVAQLAIEKRSLKNYDVMRTARFFVVNGFLITPFLSRWYLLLEKIKSGPAKLLPLKRVLVDQCCFSPCLSAYVLTCLRALEGHSLSDSVAQCKRDWFGVWSTSVKIWPAATLFTFYVVPLQYRVIFVQFVALFWNSYLSFATQKKVVAHP